MASISLKTKEEIRLLKEGGKRLSAILDQLADFTRPGLTTLAIEKKADELFKKSGGQPSFKGFQGFPAASCISVNEELVHGIPRGDKVIKEGDIVSIDVGLRYKGLFTDMATTIPIGQVADEITQLLQVTKEALHQGINQAQAGNTIGHIGQTIQGYAEKFGYGVIRSLVGHGVGHAVHEEPRVPNFGQAGTGPKLQTGMVLALEPMVALGSYEVETKKDGWTVVMADGLRCAHFEHTIAVTDQGPEIITKG